MSNSPLVDVTVLSPNHSGQRTHTIDRITPHCVVGQVTAERLGEIFLPTSKRASSNYGVDKFGRIGMYVPENYRSWCSSSSDNDDRAVTIECASDTTHPYAFTDNCYEALVDLCTDICLRNGKSKLLWIPDKATALVYKPAADEMLLTVHRWFANKACPGDWLMARMGDLAAQVTARLQPEEDTDMRYNRVDDMPLWAQPTIAKLCDAGILHGTDDSEDSNGWPASLDLSSDMLRMLVIHDRLGLYD